MGAIANSRVLIICHPKPDWMVDYLYQGCVDLHCYVDVYPYRQFYSHPIDKLKEESHRLLQPLIIPNRLTFLSVWINIILRKYDLIIVSSMGYIKKGGYLSSTARFIKSLMRRELSWRYMHLFPINSPVVVVDGLDEGDINNALLENGLVKCYYKREFANSLSLKHEKKILPIRFGINVRRYNEVVGTIGSESKSDICYIMSSSNHNLRKEVKNRLRLLEGKYRIFIHDSGADGKISISDYAAIVRSSRITLSISGLGWDCLRHYEIPAIGSVLLVNEPTIKIGDFFADGEECIMFANDLSDFDSKLEYYLSDYSAERLELIRKNGMRAVRDRFDIRSTAKYVLRDSLVN